MLSVDLNTFCSLEDAKLSSLQYKRVEVVKTQIYR